MKRRLVVAVCVGLGALGALWFFQWRKSPIESEIERVEEARVRDMASTVALATSFATKHAVKPWRLSVRTPAAWTCRESEPQGWTQCDSPDWSLRWEVKKAIDQTPARVLADFAEQAWLREMQSPHESSGSPTFYARMTLAGFDGYLTIAQSMRGRFLQFRFQGWRADGKGGRERLEVATATESEMLWGSPFESPPEGLAVLLTTAASPD